MAIGKLAKTKYSNVYRRADHRLVVRVTARVALGKWSQLVELQDEGSDLEAARRRAEVLRQRVQEAAEAAKSEGIAPPKTNAAAPRSTETVTEYARRWYEAKKPRLKLGPQKRLADALWDKILPKLGNLRVGEVSRTAIESWVGWAERARMPSGERYAQDTLTGWWRVLCLIVRDMAADHDLPDPLRRVRPPKSPRTGVNEHGTLSDEELMRFLEAVRSFAPQHYVAILTLAQTGMRVGELFALKWDNIDFRREEIRVARTISGGAMSPTTKTITGRTVPMPTELVEALKEHRKTMMANQHPGLADNWVFCTDNGRLRLPQSLNKAFALCREAAKIEQRVSPQVLRRTMNTMLLRAGVDRIVLRSMMGHCSEEMTQRYAGVASNDKKAAILKVFPGGPCTEPMQ